MWEGPGPRLKRTGVQSGRGKKVEMRVAGGQVGEGARSHTTAICTQQDWTCSLVRQWHCSRYCSKKSESIRRLPTIRGGEAEGQKRRNPTSGGDGFFACLRRSRCVSMRYDALRCDAMLCAQAKRSRRKRKRARGRAVSCVIPGETRGPWKNVQGCNVE